MSETPLVTREDIASGVRRLGISAGDGLMVHSSLKSFGRVEGGPETVIDALMDVLTPDGTLMMPSFNHGVPFHDDGLGYYDPTETSTTNGAIPELFWRRPDVLRSLNPVHAFAAWGARAEAYLADHHRMRTVEPLARLADDGGVCLLLGVGYKANTFHHVVEMRLESPCLSWRTEAYDVRLPEGRIVEGRNWSWRAGGCPFNDPARYEPLMAPVERRTDIGNCQAVAYTMRDAFDIIAGPLREGMGEFPPCSGCPVRPQHTDRTVPSDWDPERQQPKPDSPTWEY